MTARRRLLPLVLVLGLGGLVAGCGGSESASGTMSAASDSAAGGSAERAAAHSGTGFADSAASAAAPQADSKNVAKPDPAAALTRLIRTATISVEVPNLAVAAAKVRADAVALGGIVSAETTGYPTSPSSSANDGTDDSDSDGTDSQTVPDRVPEQSVLTLRVPEPRMDDALGQVIGVGKLLGRSTTSKDVTGSIADLDSRVKTQTRSVDRIRDLMDKATSLKDVVLIEGELSKREADLESLQAQQRVLVNKADLSTITVTLSTPAAVAKKAAKADTGFLPGLRGGWNALTATIVVVLTGVGAVLPFAVIALILGVPGYLIYRRFRPRRHSTPPASSSPATSSSPPATP